MAPYARTLVTPNNEHNGRATGGTGLALASTVTQVDASRSAFGSASPVPRGADNFGKIETRERTVN